MFQVLKKMIAKQIRFLFDLNGSGNVSWKEKRRMTRELDRV